MKAPDFWLGVLNDLRARGIEDILIASIDGLKGFPEAIARGISKSRNSALRGASNS